MNAGTENRRKTMIAGALGTLALLSCGYYLYNNFIADTPPTPAPAIAPINSRNSALNNEGAAPTPANAGTAATSSGATSANTRPNAILPTGNAAGVNAKKVASTSANLDPSLDESAMLRTERLVYTGSGRNIFSAVYTPPAPKVEKPLAPPRPKPCPPNCPPPPPPPPPPPTCPPSCPPIQLKFFGTATRPSGSRQAFLLQGEDVFLASEGDIVARKYKIVSIRPSSIEVQDLTNNNTQTLPLQN